MLGEYIEVVLENSALENAHINIHEFAKVFDGAYVTESFVDWDVVKLRFFYRRQCYRLEGG